MMMMMMMVVVVVVVMYEDDGNDDFDYDYNKKQDNRIKGAAAAAVASEHCHYDFTLYHVYHHHHGYHVAHKLQVFGTLHDVDDRGWGRKEFLSFLHGVYIVHGDDFWNGHLLGYRETLFLKHTVCRKDSLELGCLKRKLRKNGSWVE